MSFSTYRMVKAAKDHDCDECAKGIKKGAIYERLFVVTDGEGCTLKFCWRCSRAWKRAHERFGRHQGWDEDNGPGVGALASWIRSEERPSCPRELAERRKRLGRTSRWRPA